MGQEILSELCILGIRSVSNIYTDAGKIAERIQRNAWGILFKYEGETVYQNLGKSYVSNPEHVMILPRGSSYTWQCRRGGHYYVIEFDAEATCDQIFCFSIAGEGEKLLRLFRDAEQKHNLRAPGYKLEAMRAAYTAILLLLATQRKAYLGSDRLQKITPALDYISQNYEKSIKNDTLAALCGISTVYFRKLFLSITGLSPITYIHTLRIGKAKKMLESDYKRLAEIAVSLGYPDVYTFSKTFKKYTGLSPTTYLKQHAEKSKPAP